MCGFIGILGSSDDISPELYEGLLTLQHRGQDAAGITTFDGRFRIQKGSGFVRDIFTPTTMKHLTGKTGIGHVRYPTIGRGSSDDAQPFQIHYPYGIAMAHNGNVTNYSEMVSHLANEKKAHLNSTCDVEVILNCFAVELGRQGVPELSPEPIFSAIRQVFEQVRGSYSVVASIANYGMVVFRDPYGVKPACYGTRTNSEGRVEYAVASEGVALQLIGFDDVKDVAPGEVIIFRNEHDPVSRIVDEKKHTPCVFEHVYFARPDSFLDGISVYKTRRRFGMKLAERFKESGRKVDVVMPVPDSACTAALTMAQVLGVEYREGLVKNRYIGRTFIMPGQKERTKSVRRKLNTIPLEFQGKTVMLVDDSIVRGTTSRQIIQLAREAGAKKVYFASCSPTIEYPCVYGIDMSTRQELVAREKTNDEICEYLGADYLIYQQVDDLVEAARMGNPEMQDFCTACFTGEYPTGDVTPEMFTTIERERLGIDAD